MYAQSLQIRQSGLTMLELLIGLVILGILTATAFPIWEELSAKNDIQASYNLFLSQLLLARSEAIKRETAVTLCPTQDGRHCLDDARAWGRGQLIFIDPEADQMPGVSPQILSSFQPSRTRITISSSASRQRITFLPSGRSWFSNTTIRFCHPQHPELNRALVISGNGRVRKASNTALSCS